MSSGKVDDSPMTMKEAPTGGLCLSCFLVVSEGENKGRILMGRLDPEAPWDHLGALDSSRAAIHSNGWMLPSSHLMVYESPQEAALRIQKEQLELAEFIELSEPKVVSEVYIPKQSANLPRHWDIEFIFCGALDTKQLRRSNAWSALEFLEISKLHQSDISRYHDDILEHVGLQVAR